MDAGFRYPEILAASFTDLPLSRALWAKANRSVTKYLPGVLSMAFLKAVVNEVRDMPASRANADKFQLKWGD